MDAPDFILRSERLISHKGKILLIYDGTSCFIGDSSDVLDDEHEVLGTYSSMDEAESAWDNEDW